MAVGVGIDDPKREIITINPNRSVTLPYWAWSRLLKLSGIRSRRKRHVKKAIKKMFCVVLLRALGDDKREMLARRGIDTFRSLVKDEGIEEMASDVEALPNV